jgi:hypothetical protein
MTGKNVATMGWNNRKAPGSAFSGALFTNCGSPQRDRSNMFGII